MGCSSCGVGRGLVRALNTTPARHGLTSTLFPLSSELQPEGGLRFSQTACLWDSHLGPSGYSAPSFPLDGAQTRVQVAGRKDG